MTPELPAVMTRPRAQELGVARHELRGPAFRRAGHGVYAVAGTDLDDPDVRVEVAAATLVPSATLGGWVAARLHERGRPRLDPATSPFDGWTPTAYTDLVTEPAPVLAPARARLATRPGTRVFRSEVPDDERTVVDGVLVTTPLRTAFDLARLRTHHGAVVALDRMLGAGLVDGAELAELLDDRRRWRGSGRALRALAQSDGGAESPRKSLLRMLWREAGLPFPVCNPEVFDASGRFVARVDLLDVESGLVGEYDGAWHASGERRRRDRGRTAALERLGLRVLTATGADLTTTTRRARWRHEVRVHRREALDRSARTERRWTWRTR